jgi:hypothetical protein
MKYTHLTIGIVTILILILLMIYSAQEYSANNPQIKKYEQVFGSIANSNNTVITFRAQIRSVNQSNHTVRVSIEEEPYNYPQILIYTGNLELRGLTKGVLIDVIGTVQGKNQVTVTKVWVDEPWLENLIYLRSLPAIPFVLFLFIRTWKFDVTTRRFQRRRKDA